MAATITTPLKTRLCQLLLDEVNDATDANHYYIGIGKSDQYADANDNVVAPVMSLQEERELRNNLQSIIKVGAASLVVARKNWTAGTTYGPYTDKNPTNYYVLTENNHVYICLKAGAAQSTVQPDFNDSVQNPTQDIKKAFETSDGYRWKYLYELNAADTNSFLSAAFIPVQKSAGGTGARGSQKTVQDDATNGRIVGFEVIDGGTGYASAPTITVIGNGEGAIIPSSNVVMNGGSVASVFLDSANGGGKNYTFADTFVDGSNTTPAKIRPIISSTGGIGADARNDLNASSIMFNSRPTGTVSNQFIVDNDFRQISLFRNMQFSPAAEIDNGDTGPVNTAAEKALRILTVADNSSINVNTDITTGSGAAFSKAHVDDKSGSTKLLIHQNSRTGFNRFPANGSIGATTLAGVQEDSSRAAPHTGELLYIENRAAISRTSAQTEDIKIVVTM